MKQQQVSVKFPTPRYKALSYYLEKEGIKIEEELQKKLEEMYREQVPKEVQEFVKAQSPDEYADEEQQSEQPKTGRRQNTKQKAESSDVTQKTSGPVLSM